MWRTAAVSLCRLVLLTVAMFKLLLNPEAFLVQCNKIDAPKGSSHSWILCLKICDTFPCPPFTVCIKLHGHWKHERSLWGQHFYWFLARLLAVLLQGAAVFFEVLVKSLKFYIYIAFSLPSLPANSSGWNRKLFILEKKQESLQGLLGSSSARSPFNFTLFIRRYLIQIK